jgi:exodeoxyribonuclease V alpha subunit
MSDINLEKMWATLLDEGVLRPIDYHFAKWLSKTSEANDRQQLLAALVSRLLGDGHICVRVDRIESSIEEWPQTLRALARSLLPLSSESATAMLDGVVIGEGRNLTPIVLSEDRFYLYQYFQYERQVAFQLSERAQLDTSLKPLHIDLLKRTADQLFNADEHPDWQKVAASNAVMNRLSVISGGPGTGKTTTVTKLLAIYLELERSQRLESGNAHWPAIQLAAPTGKAAARLSESIALAKERLSVSEEIKEQIPTQGQTLHRLLGVKPNQNQVKYHRDNPLHVDLLVVDEASMIDLPLMTKLLDALPKHAKLVLIGDRYQLASVEAGSVMGDLCDQPASVAKSEELQTHLETICQVERKLGIEKPMANAVSFLKKSYRFRDDSGIGALAFAVNNGDISALKAALSGSLQDIDQMLMEMGEDVGLATVYRVLTQFEAAGLVSRHHFEGGHSVFELARDEQHDHIVCVKCGRVREFTDPILMQRQNEIAKELGFNITDRTLYLYGVCADGCEEA